MRLFQIWKSLTSAFQIWKRRQKAKKSRQNMTHIPMGLHPQLLGEKMIYLNIQLFKAF